MAYANSPNDRHHPPGYSEMDETRRTTFLPGSPEWHESQLAQQQQQQQHHNNGNSIVDHYYQSSQNEPSSTAGRMNTYASQIEEMFMPLDNISPNLDREVYATEYVAPAAELTDTIPRQYLTDEHNDPQRMDTYATEYSRYLDHQAADEMEMPHYSHYSNEKINHQDMNQYDNQHGAQFYDENFADADYHGYNDKVDPYHTGKAHKNEDIDSGDEDEEEEEEEENSPIEIVAVTVSTFDDPTLPCLTFRFWVISAFFTVLGATISQIFYFRATPLQFSIFFVQLIAYPIGVLMAKTLPRKKYSIFGKYFYLNPGPFNMKEHMLITVSVNTGGTIAYAIDVLAVQRLYYNLDIKPLGSILLLLSTQCVGYGLAGAVRKFLVKPANMVWPSTLVQVALYNTLHAAESATRNFTRQRFFFTVLGFAFFYNFLPGLMAPVLSSMALLCWTLKDSAGAQVLGSGLRGMGLLNLSLDWSYIGATNPLYTPWWAQLNFFLGVIASVWIVAPSLYFTKTLDAHLYDPVSSTQYDEDANEYDIGRIIDEDYKVNSAKLEAYSGVRMAPYLVFVYFMSLATVTATLTHVFLYYRQTIYRQFVASRNEKEDIHSRMMRAYPDVPISWFVGMFIVTLVAAIIVCEVYPIKVPWWALLVCIVISGLLILPMGIIQAVSNNRIGLNVLSELIGGYLIPGRPIANATFKCFGYMTMFQCLVFIEDMKLGHYMKIPPRKLFVVQLWGTIIGAFANYAMFEWILWKKGDVLSGKEVDLTGQWIPRNSQVFYSATIIWGAYGPGRMFGPDSPYRIVLWGFLVGLLLPIPFYLLHKRFPGGKWHLINIPIFAIGTQAVPLFPANFLMSSFIVAFIFQYFVYRRHHGWWKRYNYIFSAAMDAGTQLSTMFITLALSSVIFPAWLGNGDNTGNFELCEPDKMKLPDEL